MQPLGYYGLNLTTESRFDALGICQLVTLMSVTADEIYDLYPDTLDNPVGTAILLEAGSLSESQKISLIKAICDRIELKLMEVAK